MSLTWEDSFSVGVAAMDHQHRRILGLIADLRNHDQGRPGAPALEEVLFSLTCYVQEHFEQEEALLARHAYPGLAGQIDDHRAFAREVAAHCMELFDQSERPEFRLLPFLEHWWRHHVLEVDMAYKPFLAARGVH